MSDGDNIVELKRPLSPASLAQFDPLCRWHQKVLTLEEEVLRLRMVIASQAIKLIEGEEREEAFG